MDNSNVPKNVDNSQEKNILKNSKTKDIFINKKGKLFEEFVAFSMAEQLGELNYKTGMKYSLNQEINRLLKCMEGKNQSIKNKMNTKISDYKKNCPESILSSSSSSEKNTSQNKKKKISM